MVLCSLQDFELAYTKLTCGSLSFPPKEIIADDMEDMDFYDYDEEGDDEEEEQEGEEVEGAIADIRDDAVTRFDSHSGKTAQQILTVTLPRSPPQKKIVLA